MFQPAYQNGITETAQKSYILYKSENRAYWLMEKPVSGNIIRSNGGNGIQFTDGNGSITGNAITANTGMCINIPTTGFMLSGNFCVGNTGGDL